MATALSALKGPSFLLRNFIPKESIHLQGHTLSELAVLIVAIASAALTILNHLYRNTGHSTYCCIVTIGCLFLYLSLKSARRLGNIHKDLQHTAQDLCRQTNFLAEQNQLYSAQIERQARQLDQFQDKLDKLSTIGGALDTISTKMGKTAKLSNKSLTLANTTAKDIQEMVQILRDQLKVVTIAYDTKSKIKDLLIELSAMKQLQPHALQRIVTQIKEELNKLPIDEKNQQSIKSHGNDRSHISKTPKRSRAQ